MLFEATRKKNIRIKSLPLQERPREKLFAKGSQNLSDTELFALLLGTGTKKQDVLRLSELILKKFPLQKLSTISLAQLQQTAGVGKGKGTRIIAAIELGKRMFSPGSLKKSSIRSLKEVIRECREISDKKQEYLLALYLNARQELLQKEIIAVGNVNAITIEPKEIFTPAVLSPCTEIILAHNHPSGIVDPSEEDIYFTKRVQEAGAIMGIPLNDHVIVSTTKYFSFKNNKIYEP